MILVSRYSKGYVIFSSKEILLQETDNLKKKSQSSYTADGQICVSRDKLINPP